MTRMYIETTDFFEGYPIRIEIVELIPVTTRGVTLHIDSIDNDRCRLIFNSNVYPDLNELIHQLNCKETDE